MSVSAVRWAIEQKTGDATAKSVLRILAWHHNPETGLCCPSLATLQDECDIKSVNTVKSALKRLIELGLVSFEREIANGAIKRTHYALHGFDPSKTDGVSAIDGGSNIDRGSIADRGSNTDGGDYQDLTLPSVKNCSTVRQNLTPKEKVEREEKVDIDTPPSFDADVPPPTEADFCLEAVSEPAPVQAPKKPKEKKPSAVTHLLSLERLPEDWRQVCQTMHPDGNPDSIWGEFRFYWTSGKGSGTRRSDKGWASTWANWVRRCAERSFGRSAPAAPNPFKVTPEQKRSIFSAKQQQPEFRNLKAPRYADEFDADVADMVKGVM